MRNLLIIFLLFINITNVLAQVTDSLNQKVGPKDGINSLAIKYYGIEFTELQRELLKDKQIEFIYLVDQKGKAKLSEINGITDAGIIDSLQQRTLELEKFNPTIRNGIPEESIYFLKMSFPVYTRSSGQIGFKMGSYQAPKLEDFEYIQKSKSRFDMLVGGMANQFFGNPAVHLGTGGGMKIELTFTDKRDFLYGMNMSVYGNKLKKSYDIDTGRTEYSDPPTLFIGAIFGKWFGKINLQAEVNYVIQNVAEASGILLPKPLQFQGWSPGLIAHYPIKLGKDKPMYFYGRPNILNHNLDIHLGIRYVSLSSKQATGWMAELGLSYRMSFFGIKSYKMKSGSN